MSGHFAFSFDSSESIRLVVIAEPTVWLYNRLMPNQSIASMPPIAGQRRYPLKVLYTVDVALQGKNAIHDNLKEAMEQGNNILGFLKSEGYFEIRQGTKCKSTDFYKVYERWCLDNLEKPLAASTFIHHLKDNQKSLGIVYDDKCIGTNRGFHNVDVDLFLPVDVPSPWD